MKLSLDLFHSHSRTVSPVAAHAKVLGAKAAQTLLLAEGAVDPGVDRVWLRAGLRTLFRRDRRFGACKTLCCVGKGGAGKSTTTSQLAVIAAKKGMHVLILDCDRQRSVSGWKRIRGSDPGITVRQCAYNHLELECQTGRKAGFDLILIDHPQQPGEAWPALVRATDLFVLLARPSVFDLSTAQAWIRQLDAGRAPFLTAITAAQPRRSMIDAPTVRDAREILQTRTPHVWRGQISTRQSIVLATAQGKGVIEYEPVGAASAEYLVLWHRLWDRLVTNGAPQ